MDLPIAELRTGTVVTPADRPVTVVCYRARETGHARALYPSRAALLAIARQAGRSGHAALGGQPDSALDAAEHDLTQLGVFG